MSERFEYKLYTSDDTVLDTVNGKNLSIGECAELLNKQQDEIERLKLELKKYHKRFDCHQCHYHNYDGLNIDDEYEVCDKGNNEALDDNHSCSEWEEL